jgi:uncharacterized protein (TIGR03437 family)
MKFRSMPALALLVASCTLWLPAHAQAQSVTYTFTYNGPALPIYHDSADIISIARIFVPRAIRITKVTANVEIDYPRPGDLNLYMYSPIFTRTKLLEKNCGSQGAVTNVTFDDAAATRYSETCPATPGTYRGNEPLSNYNDQTSFGTWSLAVENNGSDDWIGYLRGFTITVTGTAVTNKPVTTATAVVNQASLESAAITPGEMLNIRGVNVGPYPSVAAGAGSLPLTLGGVQVTFGGTPAAISYASSNLLAVQVPYGIVPGQPTEMRVIYQNTSDPVSLDVLNAAPGVYTQSADGKGGVTAVNPDGTMNSALRPAPKGRQVAIYAAGLGAVNPSLGTGQMPPLSPISFTTFPVTAVVDGYQAEVSFAGLAPGFPGIYQVNLTIPVGARSGAQSLTLFAAGTPSQSDITIYVQ